MAKAAFRVEDGIIPGGHNTMDFGHANNRFRHAYLEGDLDVDGNVAIENNLSALGTVTLPNFSGGGGGGGGDVTKAEAIAFAVALG